MGKDRGLAYWRTQLAYWYGQYRRFTDDRDKAEPGSYQYRAASMSMDTVQAVGKLVQAEVETRQPRSLPGSPPQGFTGFRSTIMPLA